MVPARSLIYVYAQAGDRILVGSRNRTADGNGVINGYKMPVGGFAGSKGDETLPGTADFTCTSGTTGLIATRAQETYGPKQSAVDANGFTPCVWTVAQAGIYGVRFSGLGSNVNANGSIATPATASTGVSAWDVTVRSGGEYGAEKTGRVFTYAWAADTGSNGTGKRIYSNLYYVTDDGYRYRQQLVGVDPNAGVFFSNALGFRDQGEPLYKNIRGQDQTVSEFRPTGISGVTADGPQYPIFFSNASPTGGTDINTTLAALGIAQAPKPPQVSSFQFTAASVNSSTSFVGQGGAFDFYVTDTISFQIVISADGVDFNPATTTNRVFTGSSNTGPYTIRWDGKNNAGNNMPVGRYQFLISGRNGEAHFPFADVEGNLYGGPIITKLNGNVQDAIVYYDDRGYVTKGGTEVGTLNGPLCGNPGWMQPSPIEALAGIDSSLKNRNNGSGNDTAYARWWPEGTGSNPGPNSNRDCSGPNQYFGDAKALNLWTYQTTLPQTNTLNIIDNADVRATVSAPVATTPGGNVLVNMGFGNVGSQTAVGVTYSVQMSAGLTGVSCAGAACSYDSATGVLTVAGLPASLTPGQTLSVSVAYTAPASGAVSVVAGVATTSDQGANVAPDIASGVTLVGGSTTADLMTTVFAPPSAVSGGVVAMPVTYANVGASSAAVSAYGITTSPGLTGVSCAPATVVCSYNPATGAVSLSGPGLPTSLAPGQSVPFTFSYIAPAAGTEVLVTSNIATSAAETNTANNTATGRTTTSASPVAPSAFPDVLANVEAPATSTPGATVEVPVRFGNSGNATAAGVAYSLVLPAGLTGVGCPAPVVCSYDAGTGVVTVVSGLPASLIPGEWADLTVRYTAPLSGVVPVTARVSTTTPGDTNPANNEATGQTTVLTAAGADVMATVNPPATVAPGTTVQVPVNIFNLGAVAAAGMAYTLELAPGLSGVACGGSGVSCTYNSTTGVATLAGLPTTLASGGNLPFTVSYTAPGGGSVPVTVGATTTTFDSNPANNTAAGSTAIRAGSTADVTTSVSAPSTAAAGHTVLVPVSFSNGGLVAAAAVGYKVELFGNPANAQVTYNGTPCSYNAATGVVSGCGLPASLVPGQAVNLVASYTAPLMGAVQVTSSITTTTAESNTANNSATASTAFTAPDLVISLDGLPQTAFVGQPYTGSFSCSNVGTADAAAGSLCGVSGLPAGVSVVSCSVNAPSPGAGWVAGDNVPVGATVTCTVGGTPTAVGGSQVAGTTGATYDSNTANNTATRAINTTAPDMAISLAGLPTTAAVGVAYNGSFSCSNVGGAAAIADTQCGVTGLPAGVAVVACTISPTSAGWSAGGSVPAGEAVTCTVYGTPTAPGSSTVAGTTGATNDSNPANNSTTRTINTTAPDMAISLAGLPATASVGVPYAGSFSCTNSGGADAASGAACGVTGLPADVTVGTCTISPAGSTWSAGSNVPAGATVSCPVSGTPTTAGNVTVTGTTGATHDSNPANNSATLPMTVTAPDMAISLAGLPTTASVGTPYSGSFSCTNIGNAEAGAGTQCGVTGLPTGVMTAGTCTISPSGTNWTAGSPVPAGATVTCAVAGTPTAAGDSTVTGTTGATHDSSAANNTDTRTINTTAPDMAISLSGLPATASVGVLYSGSFSCTNTGNADAAAGSRCGVTGLPAGVDVVGCTISPANAPWSEGSNVPAGQTVTCTVSGTPTTSGSATVTGTTGATHDSNPANNSTTQAITVAAPDMSVSLAGLPATAAVGVPYTGSFSCSNVGTADATGATRCSVTGLPSGLSVGACTISPSGTPWSEAASVPAGATVTCPVSGTPTALGSSTVTGTTGATSDSNTANNMDTRAITVSAPDMSISLAGLPSTAAVGTPYTGSFTCTNGGGADATAGTLCSVAGLPAGLAVGTCTISPSGTPWTEGGSVPAGATVTCPVSGTPTAPGSSTVTGTTGATNDSNLGNDTATRQIATAAPDMGISLDGLPSTSTVGVPYKGTFSCTNGGTADAVSGTLCEVASLPAGLTVSACTVSPAAAPWRAGDAVPMGATVTCAVTGTPTERGGSTVTGTTGASHDTQTANNTATRSISVSGGPLAVPTLSQWALLMLSLLMLLAMGGLRRRN